MADDQSLIIATRLHDTRQECAELAVRRALRFACTTPIILISKAWHMGSMVLTPNTIILNITNLCPLITWQWKTAKQHRSHYTCIWRPNWMLLLAQGEYSMHTTVAHHCQITFNANHRKSSPERQVHAFQQYISVTVQYSNVWQNKQRSN